MGEESAAEQEQQEKSAAALSAALGAASRARADEFLAEQTKLTRLQIEREEKEERLRGWQLFVGAASGGMKLAFESVVALIVILIAIAIGAALWNAAHDDGLVIESFSVPPDMAERGLTGEVVAAKVLDRLTALQQQTASNRAASTYVNNWGGDIKLQIPETGVSIGQLYRYLAQWLGHETHISGEIYRDAKGLVVTVRVAGSPAMTARGADAELDNLVQQSAEGVYRRTQPYRYAVYLDGRGRTAEARAIYDVLIHGNDAQDRAWAYIGLASERNNAGDVAGGKAFLRKAMAIRPDILLIYFNIASDEANFQHDEQSYAANRAVVARAGKGPEGTGMDPISFKLAVLVSKVNVAGALGDAAEALRLNRQILQMRDETLWENARENNISFCGALHDRQCFADALDVLPASTSLVATLGRAANIQQADAPFEDWKDIVDRSKLFIAALEKLGAIGRFFIPRAEYPLLALAKAHLGDFKAAHALADQMPGDCVVCIGVRGKIADLERRFGAADYWYARAVRAAPSLPGPLTDWCESMLLRGDAARAALRCEAAVARGPRDFEALALWGRALLRLNRADLAIPKFAAAARLAPNWGGLHLKWGEALLWRGDRAGAAKQFALAHALYLTPAETAELKRVEPVRG
jgi:tetratricopeptide (TPR) repeat protein